MTLLLVEESKALDFDSRLHPRDRHGKFAKIGATVNLPGGGRGVITGFAKNGHLDVALTNGSRVQVDPKLTTVVSVRAVERIALTHQDARGRQLQAGDSVRLKTGAMDTVTKLNTYGSVVHLAGVGGGPAKGVHLVSRPSGPIASHDKNGVVLHRGDRATALSGRVGTVEEHKGNGEVIMRMDANGQRVTFPAASLVAVNASHMVDVSELHVGDNVATINGDAMVVAANGAGVSLRDSAGHVSSHATGSGQLQLVNNPALSLTSISPLAGRAPVAPAAPVGPKPLGALVPHIGSVPAYPSKLLPGHRIDDPNASGRLTVTSVSAGKTATGAPIINIHAMTSSGVAYRGQVSAARPVHASQGSAPALPIPAAPRKVAAPKGAPTPAPAVPGAPGAPTAGSVYVHSTGGTLTIQPNGIGVIVGGPAMAPVTVSPAHIANAIGAGQWTLVPPAAPTPVPPSAPAPSVPAARAPVVDTSALPTIDTTGFTRIGAQAGSNTGGVFHDPKTGVDYYLKSFDALHADNETAAAALYRAAGVNVPDVHRADLHGQLGAGKTGIASRIVPQTSDMDARMSRDAAYRDAVLSDFAAHAWLGNWDAVANNNTATETATGKPLTIDVGGSVLFRARADSAPKTAADFSPTVKELVSMRRSGNSGATFTQLTPDSSDKRFVAGVERIAAVTPAQIDGIVDANYPNASPAQRDIIKKTLKARRVDLATAAGVTLPEHASPAVDGGNSGPPNVPALPAGMTLTGPISAPVKAVPPPRPPSAPPAPPWVPDLSAPSSATGNTYSGQFRGAKVPASKLQVGTLILHQEYLGYRSSYRETQYRILGSRTGGGLRHLTVLDAAGAQSVLTVTPQSTYYVDSTSLAPPKLRPPPPRPPRVYQPGEAMPAMYGLPPRPTDYTHQTAAGLKPGSVVLGDDHASLRVVTKVNGDSVTSATVGNDAGAVDTALAAGTGDATVSTPGRVWSVSPQVYSSLPAATHLPPGGKARDLASTGATGSMQMTGALDASGNSVPAYAFDFQMVPADQLKGGDTILINGQNDKGPFVVSKIDQATLRPGHTGIPNPPPKPAVFGRFNGVGPEVQAFRVMGGREAQVQVNPQRQLPGLPAIPTENDHGITNLHPMSFAGGQAAIADPNFLAVASGWVANPVVGRAAGKTPGVKAVPSHSGNGALLAGALAHARGFDGLPEVVTEAELHAGIAAGGIDLWRGIDGSTGGIPAGVSPLTDFAAGAYFPGAGVYGQGSYASRSAGNNPGSTTATGYARLSNSSTALKPQSGVWHMTLKPEATTIALSALNVEQARVKLTGTPLQQVLAEDPGWLATYLGYDAITLDPPQRYVVILNRTAVRVAEEPLMSRADVTAADTRSQAYRLAAPKGSLANP